ncbi:MAG: EpsG family protein [Roseburia sp.]|nr:EpsG family protein [Roseburia sp.]
MESSALVYILLTAVTVGLALCIDNSSYVAPRLQGGRAFGAYRPFQRCQARNLVAEFMIYCLLTGVSACRIAVGNDYWVYRDNFKLIAQERHVSSEFGFNYMVRWIQQLFGYDKYLPVFAFFSILTVFFFVKALHDQASDYALSLFLLLTGGYYFNSLNSVRYYLALAMVLYAMKYVFRRDYGKFLLWVLGAAVFHKTALLVIPVYLVAWYLAVTGIKKWHWIPGGVFVLSLLFGQKLYRWILFRIYPYYENSLYDNGQISYINIGKCVCVLALCLICYKQSIKDNPVNRFYFFLNLFGLAVFCCGSFIPETTRIAYYMIVAQIFLLPRVLRDIPWKWFRRFCYIGVTAAFLLYFGMLLRNMYDINIRLLPYLNWIFN